MAREGGGAGGIFIECAGLYASKLIVDRWRAPIFCSARSSAGAGLHAKTISKAPTCYFLQLRSGPKRASLSPVKAMDRQRREGSPPNCDTHAVGHRSAHHSATLRCGGTFDSILGSTLEGAAPMPNLTTLYGLKGHAWLTDSVDTGWQLGLLVRQGCPVPSGIRGAVSLIPSSTSNNGPSALRNKPQDSNRMWWTA